MVISRPLLGQEEANARYLLSAGAAAAGGSSAETAQLCAEILHDGVRLELMRENARRAGRPRAAEEIAAELLAFAGARLASRSA